MLGRRLVAAQASRRGSPIGAVPSPLYFPWLPSRGLKSEAEFQRGRALFGLHLFARRLLPNRLGRPFRTLVISVRVLPKAINASTSMWERSNPSLFPEYLLEFINDLCLASR